MQNKPVALLAFLSIMLSLRSSHQGNFLLIISVLVMGIAIILCFSTKKTGG